MKIQMVTTQPTKGIKPITVAKYKTIKYNYKHKQIIIAINNHIIAIKIIEREIIMEIEIKDMSRGTPNKTEKKQSCKNRSLLVIPYCLPPPKHMATKWLSPSNKIK